MDSVVGIGQKFMQLQRFYLCAIDLGTAKTCGKFCELGRSDLLRLEEHVEVGVYGHKCHK